MLVKNFSLTNLWLRHHDELLRHATIEILTKLLTIADRLGWPPTDGQTCNKAFSCHDKATVTGVSNGVQVQRSRAVMYAVHHHRKGNRSPSLDKSNKHQAVSHLHTRISKIYKIMLYTFILKILYIIIGRNVISLN